MIEASRRRDDPVMAKCRIGHFAEARFCSRSASTMSTSPRSHPGRRVVPRRQVAFTVPFVCGATNLGEALRRIGEGAALIRSKGEPAAATIVEAVRHLRMILGAHRHHRAAGPEELYRWATYLRAPLDSCRKLRPRGSYRFRSSARRHRDGPPMPRWSCSSARSRCSSGAGSSSLLIRRSAPVRSSRRPRTHRRRHRRQGVAGLGRSRCAARRSAPSTSSSPTAVVTL